jgi:hypothetical protein
MRNVLMGYRKKSAVTAPVDAALGGYKIIL